MTRAAKQWATTGFIIGVGAGIAVLAAAFILLRGAPVASAAPAASAQTQAAPSEMPLLSGTITLDARANVPVPAVVFLIARGDASKGHPVLAKRLDVTSFPARFSLTGADAMTDGMLPGNVTLEARIDRDGDAMTRENDAPSGIVSAAMGANGLSVTLR